MQKDIKKHVYFIGIGGKGLNSLAEFCLSKGYCVSGSDTKRSSETDSLEKKGVLIHYIQQSSNITEEYSVVVYSSIISSDHPERVAAHQKNITQMSRAEFLGSITNNLIRISVAGSHGKSTTSALASIAIELESGSVNSITGSYIKEFRSYQRSSNSPYCVVEACEYSRSFLSIPGDYTIITSLEKSHMEYFKNERNMNQAFVDFVAQHKKESTLILNGDNPMLRQICFSHKGKIITCGFNSSNDYQIKHVVLNKDHSIFSIYKNSICVEKEIKIKIPGKYNILNVAFVFILLRELGYPTVHYKNKLLSFEGVGRRFEMKRSGKLVFVDDFAHHPTQVKNLIDGVRQFFPKKKILAIFEPRQYHLIKTFLKEYGKSFNRVDEVCVTDVVAALGDTKEDISSLKTKDIIKSVTTYSKPKSIWHAQTYEKIVEKLLTRNLSNFVIVTIGAGPIYRVRDLLINKVQ